ncbi:hypothetical protein Lesp02_69160 [Lentzea sp. NBRC 105346]|uniref:ABC transporter substrate-binding protein n=1 Tax=Lentzea sp. NBRC 105346 TaxID=3032205 RepID=UPI0024A5521E|nr:ABC transporter substrate-binding protein [Lentzea sp. NBRC 105346]GLZ34729.1 hypothetical protein Lesp02_69160 [Lentzea sp. NBRC 105346]
MSLRLLFVMALLVSACTSAPPPEPPPVSETSVAPAVFPVTVKHEFGEVTVPKKPERVVALGWNDVALANVLDAVVVGAVRSPDPASPNLPYVKALLSDEVLTLDPANPDFGKVAALQPDLILATSAALDAGKYAELSKIAPTVARPSPSSTMDEDAKLAGEVLGNPVGARRLVDSADQAVAKLKEEMPRVVGKTYHFGVGDPSPFLETLGLQPGEPGSAAVWLDVPVNVVQFLKAPNVVGVQWAIDEVKPALSKVA